MIDKIASLSEPQKEPHPAIEAMEYAAHEIRQLRRENEILRAKVSTFELMASLLPRQNVGDNRGCTIDAAWKLDRAVADMKTKPEAAT
jgi:hypothetical protein